MKKSFKIHIRLGRFSFGKKPGLWRWYFHHNFRWALAFIFVIGNPYIPHATVEER